MESIIRIIQIKILLKNKKNVIEIYHKFWKNDKKYNHEIFFIVR